ncbi:calcium-binding protein [Marinivivus vitaminiproducens]|uniref:calcium-binding protein n=1 Tax=Marinivivus vitaminiproducens TaxID=3035935 RepID=UPI0027A4D601|nr:type I secretion C-terminal target domain-containing protein [Geminicoccaceae bacterium SCSIO 64248]
MATFTGTNANEVVRADFVSPTVVRSPAGSFPTAASDTLIGNGGSDELRGGGGGDVLYAYETGTPAFYDNVSDDLYGGDGNDTLHASYDDTLNGGAGTDAVDLGDYDLRTSTLTSVERLQVGPNTSSGTQPQGSLSAAQLNGFDLIQPRPGQNTGFLPINEGGTASIGTKEGMTYLSIQGPNEFLTLTFDAGTGTKLRYVDGAEGANVTGGDSNDTYIGNIGAETFRGGAGNDTFYPHTTSPFFDTDDDADKIYGGGGNDHIQGSASDTVYNGGSGTDTLAPFAYDISSAVITDVERLQPSSDAAQPTVLKASQLNAFDTIIPLTGWDEAYIRLTSGGTHDLDPDPSLTFLVIDASNQSEQITIPSGSTTRLLWDGNGGSDTAKGGARIDSLYGGSGNDEIWGNGDNDVMGGGTGADIVYGNSGNDTAFLDEDNDSFYGGTGDDTGYGGIGDDRLSGWHNNDDLYGGDGDDDVYGENDNDTLYGGANNDALYGGSGTDVAYGDANTDTVYGGDDGDRIYGGDGNDTLYGGAGVDRVSGSAGFDKLTGGSSGDTFVASAQGPGVTTPDQILDFATGDRIDFSPFLPGFDEATQDLSDYVRKSVSGTTVTFHVDADAGGPNAEAAVIQALNPSGGQLTGLSIDQLHDQGILLV